MTTRYSLWSAAEDMIDADYTWIVEGPWTDAEYELTLDSALEHLQLCCEAVVDDYDGGDIRDDIAWLECRDDVELLETLLYNMEEDHRWYNELKELIFMTTLATA